MLLKRWRAIAGTLLFLQPAWVFIKWAADWIGRYDAITSRLHDFGGQAVLDFIQNPPAWSFLPSIGAGLLLIWWDVKRKEIAATSEAPAVLYIDPYRKLRLGFYSICGAIAVSVWVVAWPTMFPAQTTPQPPPSFALVPKPPAPAPATPPPPPPPWVMPYEIEQQQKVGRTLLIYSSTEMASMYALGQNLNAYLNKWVKIDDPIMTLPVSETIEKKEYYVVRMQLTSGGLFGADQIAAYFEPKKWGDRLLNVRTHDHLKAMCQFVGFDRVLVNEAYKVYSHVLIGRNCELP